MSEIYKIVFKAEDYPNENIRIVKLQPGDEFYISYKGIKYKLGQMHLDYPACIKEIIYKPRPWYFFWKKKEILGYFLRWVGE